MRSILENKKAVAPIALVAFIIIALLAIYVVLWLPIPSFAKIRSLIHYFMIIIFWLTVQVGIVYGYFKLGKLAVRGWDMYKDKIANTNIKIKRFLLNYR